MPASRGLGEDTGPAIALLEQPRIAQLFAVGGPEFHEKPASLETELSKDEKILPQLGHRGRQRIEDLSGIYMRQGAQQGEVPDGDLSILQPRRACCLGKDVPEGAEDFVDEFLHYAKRGQTLNSSLVAALGALMAERASGLDANMAHI
jgi:hypothetical protein